jgi:magnesium transporter
MPIERALYRDGRRMPGEPSLDQVVAALDEPGAMAWIGLEGSSNGDLAEVANAFGLHPLAIEDAVHAHQRPKLEFYGETLFCVLRPARYLDATETVEFGEVHLFAGDNFVVTVRHGEMPDLSAVQASLEARPDLLVRGPMAVVHAVMDRVVDDYAPVVGGLENDLDEIEDQVFSEMGDATQRIYELTREVIAFQRALAPFGGMIASLTQLDDVDSEERRYLRDVHDHSVRLAERIAAFRELLGNLLQVNLTLEARALAAASNDQTVQTKKISAWAAIIFAPTLVGTIYGMNFERMPELQWDLGYPLALALMLAIAVGLFAVFKRRGWI